MAGTILELLEYSNKHQPSAQFYNLARQSHKICDIRLELLEAFRVGLQKSCETRGVSMGHFRELENVIVVANRELEAFENLGRKKSRKRRAKSRKRRAKSQKPATDAVGTTAANTKTTTAMSQKNAGKVEESPAKKARTG